MPLSEESRQSFARIITDLHSAGGMSFRRIAAHVGLSDKTVGRLGRRAAMPRSAAPVVPGLVTRVFADGSARVVRT